LNLLPRQNHETQFYQEYNIKTKSVTGLRINLREVTWI